MMKVIIAGSRGITNIYHLHRALQESGFFWSITEVVSGTARGVDRLGEEWAKERGISITRFTPDWDTHGKRAGYLRNSEMAEYADALLALWDGKSRGTKHMIDLARKKGLRVYVMEVVVDE